MTEQLTLPLCADPAPPRTKHTYRGHAYNDRTVGKCTHCGMLRRFTPSGMRGGGRFEWSRGDDAWTRKPGPCVSKR